MLLGGMPPAEDRTAWVPGQTICTEDLGQGGLEPEVVKRGEVHVPVHSAAPLPPLTKPGSGRY